MLGQTVQIVWIESAEMEKPDWRTVHQKFSVRGINLALAEVPVSDIVGRIAKNIQMRKREGRQISPTLIEEKATRQVHQAVVVEAFAQQMKVRQRFRSPADRKKSKIVHTRPQKVEFAGTLSIVYRLRHMRSHNHRSTLQPAG